MVESVFLLHAWMRCMTCQLFLNNKKKIRVQRKSDLLFRQAVASVYYSPRVIELAGEKNYEQEFEFSKKLHWPIKYGQNRISQQNPFAPGYQTCMAFLASCMLICPLASGVQKLDSSIFWMNNWYPVDKYQENQLRYPLDSDLSIEQGYPLFEQLGVIF